MSNTRKSSRGRKLVLIKMVSFVTNFIVIG